MPRRIVYLSWPAQKISGGIKLAYRHVEVLHEAGYPAIVATQDGQSPAWFATIATTVSLDDCVPSDILVFPENNPSLLERFQSWDSLKVVLCQNQFLAHRGLTGKASYSDYGVTEVIGIGRKVTEFCERRLPDLRIASLKGYVDTSLFRFGHHKLLQIAYAPRKRPQEVEIIRDLFRAEHPEYREIPWIGIQNCSEAQVAQILADSAIYLSLCRFEAYSLSILEAMACGCLVAGFTGQGGLVYANSSNGLWSPEDDCLDAATQLARAVRLASSGSDAYADMVNSALAAARQHSRKPFANSVIRYWECFLERTSVHPEGNEHSQPQHAK